MSDKAIYNPTKSHVAEDALTTFLHGTDYYDMKMIPGIGSISTKKLCESKVPDHLRINNGYSLIGVFLCLSEEGQTEQQHMDAFCEYLRMHDVKGGHHHAIATAVGMKVAQIFPGLYSREKWEAKYRDGGKAGVEAASPALASPNVLGA